MSAHVLLNLLNELRKSPKMQVLPAFYCFLQRVKNTRARMLDPIYHMTYMITLKSYFWQIKLRLCHCVNVALL